MEEDEYPDNLWSNLDLEGFDILRRNCCRDGPFDPSLTSFTCSTDNV
ncbi:unnamed protein product [Ectocarpus sp. 12 AP-2014]